MPTKYNNIGLLSAPTQVFFTQTRQESMLWQNLRRKQMLGAQFFRQRPTGNYIDDFCTRSVELIIENTIEAKTVPVQHGQLIELC